ncbi:3,4-dioxygenase subunit beta [Actinokineospora guangxiensis]|uniref:3,4-dioxygenase subunit beta n=1 Tax=Actinokineospora guangxiensis TaxID=1490288 RepID=A0ABW0EVD1_9PSEU
MGRTFEGRPLPRPGDEVVDQGLAFDIGTLMSRRRTLRLLGIGAAAGLAACSTAGTGQTSTPTSAPARAAGEIPEETAGPYPGDGSNGPDVLEQSGVVRRDIRTSFGDASGTAEGVALTLTLTVTDLAAGTAFAGAAVYVWHCTREGGYSLYSEGIESENYLRGVQVADAAGRVTFTTVFPGCYDGRWPHIHFEVYPDESSITDSANAIATSQVALPQETCAQVYAEPGYESSVSNLARVSLDGDNVFGDDGGALQLATMTGDPAAGFTATLAVGVDTTTAPGGSGPVGGPGGGGPGGPGGSGPGGPPPSR